MAGLVPAIHACIEMIKGVDARNKRRHDAESRCHAASGHPRAGGIQYAAFSRHDLDTCVYWIPAFAGMTSE